jgi:hypothetical protein
MSKLVHDCASILCHINYEVAGCLVMDLMLVGGDYVLRALAPVVRALPLSLMV